MVKLPRNLSAVVTLSRWEFQVYWIDNRQESLSSFASNSWRKSFSSIIRTRRVYREAFNSQNDMFKYHRITCSFASSLLSCSIISDFLVRTRLFPPLRRRLSSTICSDSKFKKVFLPPPHGGDAAAVVSDKVELRLFDIIIEFRPLQCLGVYEIVEKIFFSFLGWNSKEGKERFERVRWDEKMKSSLFVVVSVAVCLFCDH